MESDGAQKHLFAFFNSGNHSGASQPHRHLQFLPQENMHVNGATSNWDLLINNILSSEKTKLTGKSVLHSPVMRVLNCASGTTPRFEQHPGIPFVHFAQSFSSEPSGSELLTTYMSLYDTAKAAVDRYIAANPGQLALHSSKGGDLSISYNLAMTTSGMVILPRRAEGTMLKREDGSEVGFVALNGTTLGGTMMVKHQEEWDLLRKRPEMLDNILTAIGIPVEFPGLKSHV